MNNKQWLKSLSTKELAKYLKNISSGCVTCPGKSKCYGGAKSCEAAIEKWLESEHIESE